MTRGGDGGGRLIGGRYLLAERLGSGAMGTVWAGLDTVVDRQVAVKEALIRVDRDDPVYQARTSRILREAKAAARAGHDSVVTVYDVIVEDGRPWIVMERVHGRTLSEVLAERGPLGTAEAAGMLVGVAEALVAAHAKGVVHRDIKPSNIMLRDDGRAVLTDFGVAYIKGEPDLTESGEVMGSIAYMSPERMAGRDQPGPAADLWSLGVVLYEMVEGESPFRRDTMEATAAAVLLVEPPPIRRATPDLASLISDLLEKQPNERVTGDVAVARLRALADAPAGAGPATGAGTPLANARRRRRRAGLGVAGIAVVALAFTPILIDKWKTQAEGGGPGARPSASATPSTSTSASGSASASASKSPTPPESSPASGYEKVGGREFSVELPRGWTIRPLNGKGQAVFDRDGFQLTVIAGRDPATGDGDPIEYQRFTEPELKPYRESTWSTATDIHATTVGTQRSATGTYTWIGQAGVRVYARNTVIVVDGRYHVLLITGPEDSRSLVDTISDHAAASYRLT